MTVPERLRAPSAAECCCCGHRLSVRELEEYRSLTDEQLHEEPYCSSCRELFLMLCRECSGRYTAGSVCEECAAQRYGRVG